MRRRLPPVLALLLLAGGGLYAHVHRQQPDFPHAEHAGLFPLCTGCHQGVAEGDRTRFYPEPRSCSGCHDGGELDRVDWQGPGTRISNLRFDHAEHDSELARHDEPAAACVDCHTPEGADRMEVTGAALPGRCLSCHTHEAREHYVDAACSTCHLPLSESGFPLARLEGLPVPEGHRADDFLARIHGEEAAAGTEPCATCHVQQRCTSCHVEPSVTPEIARIPVAPPDRKLPSYGASYPTPASHRERTFLESHGRGLDPAECSTCHTATDCTGCHVEPAPPALAALPRREPTRAPGVGVGRRTPLSHRSVAFLLDHGTEAAASPARCQACHTEASCTDCHEAQREPSFHPTDFLVRHSTQAYGQRLECATCHNTEVFCRDCHRRLGMGSQGRLGPGFHNAEPLWLLRHGQPARQELESCTSCHTQSDCLQCHSQRGAFQVSPHGPGFDAERAAQRNRQVCAVCHLTDPLGGDRP